MRKIKIGAVLLCLSNYLLAQDIVSYADSIRIADTIPELAFAVVNADSTLEISFLGHHSIDLPDTATASDRFHLGSNTKAMTGFIIAKYVEEGKLNWDTKFFDLFPKWKEGSDSGYYNITLQDLLTHRARIHAFTESSEGKIMPKLKGRPRKKRKTFGKFVLTLTPLAIDSNLKYTYSNAGYTLAALMLEKAAHKSWERLVKKTFNKKLKIDAGLSWPDNQSKKDTWGHWIRNGKLVAVPSTIDYHLDFAAPAGDINLTLPDYIKFIQLNINGLMGKDNYLKSSTYNFLLKGVDNYSIGWGNKYENGKEFSAHAGSAGTYFCYTSIDRKKYIAYIMFMNTSTKSAAEGARQLLKKLKHKYGS